MPLPALLADGLAILLDCAPPGLVEAPEPPPAPGVIGPDGGTAAGGQHSFSGVQTICCSPSSGPSGSGEGGGGGFCVAAVPPLFQLAGAVPFAAFCARVCEPMDASSARPSRVRQRRNEGCRFIVGFEAGQEG